MVEEKDLVIQAADCKITDVTVFTDRAEITREVILKDLAPGQNNILIKGLSRQMDSDSVRAKGFGDMVLRSVSSEVNYPKEEVVDESDAAVFNEKIRIIKEKIAEHNRALARSAEEFELLEAFVNGIFKNENSGKNGASRNNRSNYGKRTGAAGRNVAPNEPPAQNENSAQWLWLDKEKIGNVSNMLSFYRNAFEEKDKRDTEITEARRLDQQKLTVVEAERRERRIPQTSRTPSQDIKVVLQALKELKIAKLFITYMVGNASWTPSYDVRATSSSTSLTLTYYGTIRQSTGEIWKGVNLSLSTAKPQVGGTPPELPTKTVTFYQPPVVYTNKKYKKRSRGARWKQNERAQSSNMRRQSLEMNLYECDEEVKELESAPLEVSRVAMAEVNSGSAGAATFKIAAVTDVESDNKPQKVTICMVDLKSLMSYFCIPTQSSNAYLQCKTTNNSSFELLPSNEVNIFFDGSYVSKSTMPSVSPGESFESFLGADSSVRITTTPPYKVNTKGGYFSKTDSCSYTLITKIKNTKVATDVFIICSKQLPQSTDASIKVTSIEPTPALLQRGADAELEYQNGLMNRVRGIKPPMNYVKLDEVKHNIVWKRIIKAQEESVFKLRYNVEWPKGREVEFR